MNGAPIPATGAEIAKVPSAPLIQKYQMVTQDITPELWNIMESQSRTLWKSGLLPQAVDSAEKAMVIAIQGRELGLKMMQSFTSICVVNGRPAISAELMTALIYRDCPAAKIFFEETTDKRAVCVMQRDATDTNPIRIIWDIQMATNAGLYPKKDNWKNYPAAMLRARALSAAARVKFPDVIKGMHIPDEMGAVVDVEGHVISEVSLDTHQKPAVAEPEEIQPEAIATPTPPPAPPEEFVKLTFLEDFNNQWEMAKQIGGYSDPDMFKNFTGETQTKAGPNQGRVITARDMAHLGKSQAWMERTLERIKKFVTDNTPPADAPISQPSDDSDEVPE